MLTYPTLPQPSRRTLSFALPLVLLIAACGTAAAPSPTPPAETPQPTPTAVPGGGGNGTGNAGGGSDPGKPGAGGIVIPPPINFPNPFPDPDDPIWGQANVMTPAQGLINQRPVSVQAVRAAVGDDGKATAELRWWSGVAPCNALDSVQIVQEDDARTIKLTVIEGSGPGDEACIEIAELKAAFVDLGVLAAGKWSISAEGDAPAITLEVD